MNQDGQPLLYAIVTGSPASRGVGTLVDLAQTDGWDVCVIASPNGRQFINDEALSAQTGHLVRSTYKDPTAPDVLPAADAMIVAPITCNSLAKWAAGVSDTLPLGLLVEAVGKRQPVVAMPFSNWAQIRFPAVTGRHATAGRPPCSASVGNCTTPCSAPLRIPCPGRRWARDVATGVSSGVGSEGVYGADRQWPVG